MTAKKIQSLGLSSLSLTSAKANPNLSAVSLTSTALIFELSDPIVLNSELKKTKDVNPAVFWLFYQFDRLWGWRQGSVIDKTKLNINKNRKKFYNRPKNIFF